MTAREGYDFEITLDGERVPVRRGETIYEVSERHRKEIPTLCYDPRLEPFGACRLCIVDVEGARNPVASCTTRAEAGMKITTRSSGSTWPSETNISRTARHAPASGANAMPSSAEARCAHSRSEASGHARA